MEISTESLEFGDQMGVIKCRAGGVAAPEQCADFVEVFKVYKSPD